MISFYKLSLLTFEAQCYSMFTILLNPSSLFSIFAVPSWGKERIKLCVRYFFLLFLLNFQPTQTFFFCVKRFLFICTLLFLCWCIFSFCLTLNYFIILFRSAFLSFNFSNFSFRFSTLRKNFNSSIIHLI